MPYLSRIPAHATSGPGLEVLHIGREFTQDNIWARALGTNQGSLTVEYPPAGELRVRNLIHRGAQRPVFKVPSVSLRRNVQCESLLEVDLALLLDIDPSVTSYGEQPATLRFSLHGEEAWHVPDFLAIRNSQTIFIEVKFEKDVNTVIDQRTQVLKEHLIRAGHSYLLLTEKQIRRPNAISNARQVLRRACHSITDIALLTSFERLRKQGMTTLGAWSWNHSGSDDAIAMAHLVMRGYARTDMNHQLDRSTIVAAMEMMKDTQ